MSVNVKELSGLCKGLKLLYVEDDAMARETTLKLLNNLFDTIVVAVDGEDGLEKFKNESFDIVLSDINMPNLNGLEMLEHIRNIDETISILLLSAHNDSQYFLQAIELSIDGYILKPLLYEQLFKAFFKITKNIQLRKSVKSYQKNLEEEVEIRNQEILHKLYFDNLTGLLNRNAFFRDLENLKTPVILLIDIDKFRVINEVFGSDTGSEVLNKFALYLSLAVDDANCKVYRLSADEFAIVDTVNFIDTEKYEELIARLFKNLNNIKLKVGVNIITIDISIGLSSADENSYECAKIALDYAKKHRKPYVMYSSAIDHRKESGLTLQCRDRIALAIDDNRVVAVYQAIVDKDENILKYETLMRLKEEDTNKLMSPFYFLDVALKTRLYERLSSTVIFKALQIVSQTDKTLSVNFTYDDIKNVSFIEELIAFFTSHVDVGSRVVFEITESQAIENYDDVKSFIAQFRKYGVRIAIDDFGSGFSNFEYILEIEPDYLKIDGSLIKDIDTDSKAHTLVEAIVQFSHKLGIKVIAEYVHSKIIFEMLKSLDVDEFQGFYFYEPSEVL